MVAAGGFGLLVLLLRVPGAYEVWVRVCEFGFRDEDWIVENDAGFVWEEAYEVVLVAVLEDGVRCRSVVC